MHDFCSFFAGMYVCMARTCDQASKHHHACMRVCVCLVAVLSTCRQMSNKDFAFPKTHMANTSASMLTVQGPGPAKGGQGGTHTEDPAIAAALGPAPYLVEEPHTSTRTPLCGCRIS